MAICALCVWNGKGNFVSVLSIILQYQNNSIFYVSGIWFDANSKHHINRKIKLWLFWNGNDEK